jgi:hypothetical protein
MSRRRPTKSSEIPSPVSPPSGYPAPRQVTLSSSHMSSPSTYPLPRQVTWISRRRPTVNRNPKSASPVKLPSSPSGYPLPRQLTLSSSHYTSPSTYPDYPRQLTLLPVSYPDLSPVNLPSTHQISFETPLEDLYHQSLESPSNIPPNLPKRNQKITKKFIQTPTFPDHLPSWPDRSPPRSFFLVGFHFIAYYLFLSNGFWYTWTSKRY